MDLFHENMDVIKNRRAQTNLLLISTLQDFNEAGTRQSGFFFITVT